MVNSNLIVQHVIQIKNGNIAAGTQRPEEVPFWSYFGRDLLSHNRSKL